MKRRRRSKGERRSNKSREEKRGRKKRRLSKRTGRRRMERGEERWGGLGTEGGKATKCFEYVIHGRR